MSDISLNTGKPSPAPGKSGVLYRASRTLLDVSRRELDMGGTRIWSFLGFEGDNIQMLHGGLSNNPLIAWFGISGVVGLGISMVGGDRVTQYTNPLVASGGIALLVDGIRDGSSAKMITGASVAAAFTLLTPGLRFLKKMSDPAKSLFSACLLAPSAVALIAAGHQPIDGTANFYSGSSYLASNLIMAACAARQVLIDCGGIKSLLARPPSQEHRPHP